ncbi:MAG: apolipoprotein N-acyltransferase [Phycisphaerales bacterium]
MTSTPAGHSHSTPSGAPTAPSSSPVAPAPPPAPPAPQVSPANATGPRPAPLWLFPLAGIAHALCMACVFPPADIWFLVPLAIVPLVYAAGKLAWSPGHMRWRVLLLLLGAMIQPLWLNRWMFGVAAIGYPAQAIYLALLPALFVWALAKWYRTVRGRIPMSLVVPTLWTGLEVLKGEFVFGGYAWHQLAHPLINAPSLAAPAAWLGTYFVSALVAAWAGIAADLLPGMGRPGSYRIGSSLVVGAATIAIWFTAAVMQSAEPTPTRDVDIAVVQTNVPQNNKNSWSPTQALKDFNRFIELTEQAARSAADGSKPDLISWPETMFPGMALNAEALAAERRGVALPPPAPPNPLFWRIDRPESEGGPFRLLTTAHADGLLALQGRIGVPMLVGATAIEGLTFEQQGDRIQPRWKAEYNSVFMLEAGAVREERYDKIALTPFGEVIPGAWRFPALQQSLVNLGAKDMSFTLGFGSTDRVFEVLPSSSPVSPAAGAAVPVRIVTPICFEATVPALCRRLVFGDDGGLLAWWRAGGPLRATGVVGSTPSRQRRADLMVNLSNDGWFAESLGVREQHLQNARWRCVELGVPMVRAVNTGISIAIDGRGRLIGSGATAADAPLVVPAFSDGVMRVRVPFPARDQVTLYCRIGDLFGYTMLALTGAGLLWILGRVSIGRLMNRGAPAS